IPWPSEAPHGLYDLHLNWYSFDPTTNATDRAHPHALTVGPVRAGDFTTREILYHQRAEFANGLVLLGYDIKPGGASSNANVASAASFGLTRGGTLNITLLWSKAHAENDAYTVFVHLIDSSGVVRAQSDRAPWDGMYPT